MDLADITWLEANGPTDLKTKVANDGTQTPFIYGQVGSLLSIDGYVCIPVEASQGSFAEYSDIEIRDRLNNPLGSLVLTQAYELDLRSISDHFYMAYLSEIPVSLYGAAYQMRYSYVIVHASRYQDYVDNYLQGSPLWGGFIHSTNPSVLIPPYKGGPSNIVAVESLSLPTSYHDESTYRSVVQPFAFERFQKLYHLLELRFDYDVVERIRTLGSDLKGIGQIFSEYGHEEIRRLKAVIEPGIKDLDALELKLNRVKHCTACEAVSKEVFFRYGKDSNPLKTKESEYDELMALGGFSKSQAKSSNLITGNGAVLDQRYRKLLTDLAAYWIYRVRSSIVHSRIGEYVMSSSDEEFVVEVAEPLLREVVVQVFRI
jgi:hypothetical protein